MRDIKFRAWSAEENKMLYHDVMHVSISGGQDNFVYRGMNEIMPDCILMQYTGSKDKNGVEIYDGDIYRYQLFGAGRKWSQPQVVKWPFTDFYGKGARDTKICEVIGNIYENPELLK